jgi:hypothetical protein
VWGFVTWTSGVPCVFGQGENGGRVEGSGTSEAAVQPATEAACVQGREAAWPVAVLILGGALILYAAAGFGLYKLITALL